MNEIKINYNDTTIITDRDIAAKFFDVDPDYMSDEHDWPDNAAMKLVIEHNANTNTLQYAVVPADYNIGNIDVWDEDSVDDFGDDIEIVKNDMTLTVEFINDDGRKWYRINGICPRTGWKFDNDQFALTDDDRYLDADGCPLTQGDYQEIAVRNAIFDYNRK